MKELELICAWHRIAESSSPRTGKLKTCYECGGKDEDCIDYAPQPDVKAESYEEGK